MSKFTEQLLSCIYTRAKANFICDLCGCCCHCSINTQIENNATGWKRCRFFFRSSINAPLFCAELPPFPLPPPSSMDDLETREPPYPQKWSFETSRGGLRNFRFDQHRITPPPLPPPTKELELLVEDFVW